MKKKTEGAFWSDTIAIKLYVIISGAFPLIFEIGVFNFTPLQWGGLHGLFYFRHLLTGRLCGKMKNYLEGRFHERVASLLAIYVYELPLYILFALIVRVSTEQIIGGVVIQLTNNALFVLPGLYDYILKRMRERFASQ